MTDARHLGDAEYFCTEAIRRLERLQRHEGNGPRRSTWQTASSLVRRVRGELRKAIDADRAERKRRAA